MDYVFDTEFVDDDPALVGISIGIVCVQDGREFYGINREMPERKVRSGWLGGNVWPYLPHDRFGNLDLDHPNVLDPEQMRTQLATFFWPEPEDGTEPNRLWAWHAGFDFVVLCRFLGGFLNVPPQVGTWVRDLKAVHVDQGCPPLPEQTTRAHHPVDDARWGVELGRTLGVF